MMMAGASLGAIVLAWTVVSAAAPTTRPSTDRPEASPSSETSAPLSGQEIVDRAVLAHGGGDLWRSLERATFEIEMQRFDTAGNPAGAASVFGITFPTDGRAEIEAGMGPVKMRYLDGATTVWNSHGEVSDPAMLGRAKFMLPTFQYILSMPWKLRDPGVRFERIAGRRDGSKELSGVRVTYAPGVGESPDDWYKFYFDEATGRLHDVLWIITAPGHNNTIEWCRFEDQRLVEGIWLPHQWTFVHADESGVTHGPPVMRARLRSVTFARGSTTLETTSSPASQPSSQPSTQPTSRPANR